MQIQVHSGDVQTSDALEAHVREQVRHAIGHFSARVTRVEAYFHDDNGLKHGAIDKRCVLEARPAGAKPIAVEAQAADLYVAIKSAATKLHRAVQHSIDRHEEHKKSH
jgi:ribosomal subunit interface protein